MARRWDTGGAGGIRVGMQGMESALVVILAGHAAVRMRGITGRHTAMGGENAGLVREA